MYSNDSIFGDELDNCYFSSTGMYVDRNILCIQSQQSSPNSLDIEIPNSTSVAMMDIESALVCLFYNLILEY